MRFTVVIHQRRVGLVEVEIPDEKWEKHTNRNVRRKMLKQAAEKLLADGIEVAWVETEKPEATTTACEIPLETAIANWQASE